MIKHIVCFRLADKSEESKKKAKEILLSMKGKVDTVKDIEVGTDFLCSDRSYDVILQVTLNSRDDLDIYKMTNITVML